MKLRKLALAAAALSLSAGHWAAPAFAVGSLADVKR